jgi:hypothetical protein
MGVGSPVSSSGCEGVGDGAGRVESPRTMRRTSSVMVPKYNTVSSEHVSSAQAAEDMRRAWAKSGAKAGERECQRE